MYRYLSFLLNNIGNIYGKSTAHIVKYICDLSLSYKKITYVFVIRKLQAESLSYGLKSVAKWAVAQIMNESSS